VCIWSLFLVRKLEKQQARGMSSHPRREASVFVARPTNKSRAPLWSSLPHALHHSSILRKWHAFLSSAVQFMCASRVALRVESIGNGSQRGGLGGQNLLLPSFALPITTIWDLILHSILCICGSVLARINAKRTWNAGHTLITRLPLFPVLLLSRPRHIK